MKDVKRYQTKREVPAKVRAIQYLPDKSNLKECLLFSYMALSTSEEESARYCEAITELYDEGRVKDFPLYNYNGEFSHLEPGYYILIGDNGQMGFYEPKLFEKIYEEQ